MKVYLAGKISFHGWRESIASSSVDGSIDSFDCRRLEFPEDPWPTLKRAIVGTHDYVGPYFIGCDHGCAHGPTNHGTQECCGATLDDASRRLVFRRCCEAIDRADVVFAWIDTYDAFGTIWELGYAIGRGKKVYLGLHHELTKCQPEEIWFTRIGASRCIYASSAEEAFLRLYPAWGLR